MKKYIVIALFLGLAVFALASQSYATDWSQYESGRDNIRLDGYDSQPGYIAFTNGNGTTYGYLYCSSDYKLYFASTGAITLSTTKLSTQGEKVGSQ